MGFALIATVVLMGVTAMIIIPFVWMLVMSFRSTGDILTDPYGLPTTINFDNYSELLFSERIAFYRYFINSFIVTVGALALTIALSTLAGYGFGRGRYHFRLRGLFFGALLVGLMLPRQILYLPQFQMMSQYGLLNTHWSLILLYTAIALPVSTYIMASYFGTLPEELEDASRIDGCGDFGTFLARDAADRSSRRGHNCADQLSLVLERIAAGHHHDHQARYAHLAGGDDAIRRRKQRGLCDGGIKPGDGDAAGAGAVSVSFRQVHRGSDGGRR